jgi:nicotinate-nucleotide adenylyltransferase
MCKDVFSSSLFEVSDCEISRGGKSFTVDTLSYLKEKYTDDELFLFMGSDMLLSFHTWYRYKDILSMCTICAIARDDEDGAEELRSYAEKMLPDGKVLIFDIAPVEVSSSQIRENIRNGISCDGLISEKTAEYIKENKLYGQ